jgi:hypothetical protein
MFVPFASWSDLLSFASSQRNALFYQAPLDTAPRPVFARKLFKNGKVRIDAGEVSFTADPAHLSRFSRRRTAADVTLESMRADALKPNQTVERIGGVDFVFTTMRAV